MKKVLVTGATRGIGKAIALDLAEKGYEVHGIFNQSKSETEKLKNSGIIFHQADLSLRADTLRIAKELVGLNFFAIVNNAGIWEADSIDDADLDIWDRTIEVNLTAPFILSSVLGKTLSKGGSIVNIASTDGMMGAYDGISYSASKSALINLTKSLGNYFGPKGVRVNAIAPGWIDTSMVGEAPALASKEMTPLRRNGKPEEIASVVEFLISNTASYINGETIVVDGGLVNTDYSLKVESENE